MTGPVLPDPAHGPASLPTPPRVPPAGSPGWLSPPYAGASPWSAQPPPQPSPLLGSPPSSGHQGSPGAWLAPGTYAAPVTAPAPVGPPEPAVSAPLSRWVRSDRWLLAAAALCLCLTLLVFSSGFQYARLVPRYEQAPAGMAYEREGLSVRLLGIVAAPEVKQGTSKPAVAPKGTVYVVARVEVTGEADWYDCSATLVLVDGRTFTETFVLRPDPAACTRAGKGPAVQVSHYFLVPEQSVPFIAGLSVYRDYQLARTTVLRP